MHDVDGFSKPKEFLEQILSNIKKWEHRFTRDQILYDVKEVNRHITPKKYTEVAGLKALASVLPFLRAPWRQNETVDSVWGSIGISNKTATVNNGNPKQRAFPLCVHKYDQFVRWVVASYGDCDYQKVAVIPAVVVYRCGKGRFCWNEDTDSMKDVTLFDLRTQAAEFREFLKR
jgi:hypothetical protein